MNSKLPILLLVIFAFTGFAPAQTKSNLETIYNLIDRSVAKADSVIGGKKNLYLNITAPQPLEVLKSRVEEAFGSKGYTLQSQKNEANQSVSYTLISLKVEYKDSFSDGIFGGTLLVRRVGISGSMAIENGQGIIKRVQFYESTTDTVKLDELNQIENQSLPFTQAPVPSLPLLSNLWEPIIVVGTLIVTVILLFTVRSK